MAINIYIKDPDKEERKFQASVLLQARKTLDGNLMILDHADITIVLVPSASKIVTFPKEKGIDIAYNAQDKLFKFLERKGAIIPDSIRSGNVYGSLEALFPSESKYADTFQVVLFMISKFIEQERPYMEAVEAYEKMEDERLLEPEGDDATELGKVPHEETKGTLVPAYPGYFYGLSGVYRY
tara:strand:- start:292 stop:837 length:546 start_codon:yes stop_codon:yes gene_type:complete